MKRNPYKRYVFILGCERSGSTWLSNIIDAHPQAVYFMEPFADYLCIFPEFPHRNDYLDHCDPALRDCVKDRINRLYHYKNPFVEADHRSALITVVEANIVKVYRKLGRIELKEGPLILQRQYSLGMNRYRSNSGIRIRKYIADPENGANVIKELRVNLKVPFFAGAFPNATYLVSLREPGAQIQSILERVKKGSLRELLRALDIFPAHTLGHDRFSDYHRALRNWCCLDLTQRLALWWRVQYETLLADLEACGLKFMVIQNETLSEDTGSLIEEMFDFCGLTVDSEVKKYVDVSTSTKTLSEHGTLDTMRDSKTYFRNRIGQVAPEIRAAIKEAWSIFPVRKDLIGRYGKYNLY